MSAMQTVAETPTFARQADKLLSEDEKREPIDFLAEDPLAGDLIPGTGGVRMLRFATSGRGKRGGSHGMAGRGLDALRKPRNALVDVVDPCESEREPDVGPALPFHVKLRSL